MNRKEKRNVYKTCFLLCVKLCECLNDLRYVTPSYSSPVWPDWAKFCHSDRIFKIFGNFCGLRYLVFCKIFNLALANFEYCWANFSLLAMANNWKSNITIWSHCSYSTSCFTSSSSSTLWKKRVGNGSFRRRRRRRDTAASIAWKGQLKGA